MNLWGVVHEKLKNEKMTPISDVDEITLEFMENERATIVEKKLQSLEDLMLKLLHVQYYSFLGKDGGKNHHFFS